MGAGLILIMVAVSLVPRATKPPALGRGSASPPDEDVRRLAEEGDAQAQFRIGEMYQKGNGVLEDYVEAVKWYRKAAEQNHAQAQAALGLCYSLGEGVAKDEAEAVKWLRKAAEQNLAIAQADLGLRYSFGKGVAKDYVEASAMPNMNSH